MGYEVGKSILYQKTGLAKSLLALDLLSKNTGDRIQPISELENHHDRLKVVSLAESDYNRAMERV